MARTELDGDGGAGDWYRCGGAVERLGGGAIINLHTAVRTTNTTETNNKCCECECDRFPVC